MSEQIHRQVKLLEFYLKGRVTELNTKAKDSPAEAETMNVAAAELQYVYDNILPTLQKALK